MVVVIPGLLNRRSPERIQRAQLVDAALCRVTTGLDTPKRGPHVREESVGLLEGEGVSSHARNFPSHPFEGNAIGFVAL